MLYENYQDIEKINKLISLGDISFLDVNVDPDPSKKHGFDYDKRQNGVVVAYKRDRNEKNVDFRVDKNLDDFIEKCRESWEEYAYLFDMGNWVIADIPYDDKKEMKFEDLKGRLETLDFIDSDIKI